MAELKGLSWQPGGQRPMTVREAVDLATAEVDCLTLDVKTYQDK